MPMEDLGSEQPLPHTPSQLTAPLSSEAAQPQQASSIPKALSALPHSSEVFPYPRLMLEPQPQLQPSHLELTSTGSLLQTSELQDVPVSAMTANLPPIQMGESFALLIFQGDRPSHIHLPLKPSEEQYIKQLLHLC